MKFFLVIFALVGLSAAVPTKSLHSDLQEFLALIPREEIRAIARKYIDNDAEVQHALAYLKGPEWAALVAQVAAKDEVKAFHAFLEKAGIDMDALVQYIHDLITNARDAKKVATTRGIREMVDEMLAVIPLGDLVVLLNDKLTNSPDFQAFYEKVSSPEAKQMVEEVRALPEVQRLAAVLREKGIDVTKVLNLVYGFFGWN